MGRILFFVLLVVTRTSLLAVSFSSKSCKYNQTLSCTIFTGLISLKNDEQKFQTTITQYYQGANLIKLKNPIKISAEITSSRIEIPIEYQTTLQNKYEHYEPIDNCPIAFRYGKCFENQVNPYVLCCNGYSKRGNGQHCLITDYENSYDVYRLNQMTLIHELNVNIESKSSKLYKLSTFNTRSTITDFGTVSMSISPQLENPRPFSIRFNNLLFTREVYNEYFLLNKFQIEFNKILITQDQWKSFAKCSDNIHEQTKTHNDIDNINDQLYMFKKNTISNYFSQNGYGSNATFQNDKIILNVKPDLILITLFLENLE